MKDFFLQRLLPAASLDKVDTALRLAETYLSCGLTVMEVTFRTDKASACIREIRSHFPDLHVGAGTLLSAGHVEAARQAGAEFGLGPALNAEVAQAAIDKEFPFIPGVSTPTEIEKALDMGFKILKLFPIKTLGGVAFIESMEGPYGNVDIEFIPMGGVDVDNLSAYLQCDSVIACGGSWLAPPRLLDKNDFSGISRIVKRSLAVTSE